jgi:hypothetical protein
LFEHDQSTCTYHDGHNTRKLDKKRTIIDDDDSDDEDANSNSKFSRLDSDINYDRTVDTSKRNDMKTVRKRNSNRKESKSCVIS